MSVCLALWALVQQAIGCSIEPIHIRHKAAELKCVQDKKVVPEDLPPMGDHWYQGFKERFPFLSLRVASSLTSTRMAAVNKFVLTFFFKLYQEALVMCGWTQDTLPSNNHIQVWNMDESFVDLSKRVYHRKVIAGVGSKSAYRRGSTFNEHITIIACVNNHGMTIPLVLLYKGVLYPSDIIAHAPASEAPDTTSHQGR